MPIRSEMLLDSLTALPRTIQRLFQAYVAVKRVQHYFNSPELSETKQANDGLQLDSVSTAFQPEHPDQIMRFELQALNMKFSRGLNLVIGSVGSGKSLLLATLLGEAKTLGGIIKGPISDNKTIPNPPRDARNRQAPREIRDHWLRRKAFAYAPQQR